MTSLGGLFLIIAIGALAYFMMQKRGGCCGGGHDHDKDQNDDKDQPRGGCCG